MAGDITQPKRPRFESNERFDTVDAGAASQASRDHIDAVTRSVLSVPRNTVATPTGLIVTGFSLTPNPTAGNDGLVRINSEVGVALDANGRSIIKPIGTTIDVTIPVGTFQIYVYYVENATDNAKRRFLPAAPPFVEFTQAIDTAFQGGLNVFLRAGTLATTVAEDVVNGATTALCLIGIATNTGAGAITITGWNAVTAPNGTDIINRLTAVVPPSTIPAANTVNGSPKTLHDLTTAALYALSVATWKGSPGLTPSASNNYGAYTEPAGGTDLAYREGLGYVTIGDGATVFGDFDTSSIPAVYADANALLTAAIAALPTAGGQILLKQGVGLSGFAGSLIALPASKTIEIIGTHSTVPSNAPQLTFAAGEGFTCSATGKLVLRDLHIRHVEPIAALTTAPCVLKNVYTENTNTADAGAAFQGTNVSDFYADEWFGSTVLTAPSLNAMLLRVTNVGRRIFTNKVRHDSNAGTAKEDCGVISIVDLREDLVLQDTTYVNGAGGAGPGGPIVALDTTDNPPGGTDYQNRLVRGLYIGTTTASPTFTSGTIINLLVENFTDSNTPANNRSLIAARADIALQDTSYIRRQKFKSRQHPCIAALCNVAAGTASTTGGTPGVIISTNAEVYVPVPNGLVDEERLQTLLARPTGTGVAGWTVDYTLVRSFVSGLGVASFDPISATSTVDAYTIPSLAPTSLTTSLRPVWLKVVTGAGGGVTLVYLTTNVDIP